MRAAIGGEIRHRMDSRQLVIRLASTADAAPLAELAARTFRDTFAVDNRPDDIALHIARAYGAEQQAAEIRDPRVRTVVVESDGRLVAYSQVRDSPSPSCVRGPSPIALWRFYIDVPWIGRGVAQRLMDASYGQGSALGGETLWLGVWEHNGRALAFYRKCGFVDVGAHAFLLGDDEQTDRIMVRPLRRG
jgi:diamine N-acetyltransferase